MFICRVWLVIKANTLIQSADEFDPLLGSSSGKCRDRVRDAIGSMYREAASDTPPDAFLVILVALLFAVPPEPKERVELGILWQVDQGRLCRRYSMFSTRATVGLVMMLL